MRFRRWCGFDGKGRRRCKKDRGYSQTVPCDVLAVSLKAAFEDVKINAMLGTTLKVPETEVKSQVEPHHSLVPHQVRP